MVDDVVKKNEDWTFLGKEIAKNREGDLIQSKDDDDRKWKLFKLKFQNDEYERSFGMFDPPKGNSKSCTCLEEGEQYHLSYNEEQIEGNKYPRLTVTHIGNPKGDDATEVKKPKPTNQIKEEAVVDEPDSQLAEYIMKYADEKDKSFPAFIVGYLLDNDIESKLLLKLKLAYTENFSKK